MKIFRKVALVVLAILVIGAIGGYAYIRHIAQRGVPDYDSQVALQGLKAPVTVYRDAYAVPHVYATHETDLYRAVGWCMAQDRLFQMDLIRRVTTGRLSEVIGEKTVEVDHLMRALRISEKSQAMMAGLDPGAIAALEAFADGVNQYIEAHRGRLPLEFTLLGYAPEPWEPLNSLNVTGYLAFDLSTGWKPEIFLHRVAQKLGAARARELLPQWAGDPQFIYPDPVRPQPEAALGSLLLANAETIGALGLAVFSGSNNWAVAGAASASGHPILANDMHLGLNAPGIWYQMHHVLEGRFNVTGVVVPGQPHITAGHNEHLAWGYTNVSADDMDFYLEKINPENPDEYEFNGAWRKMTVRREQIRVKGDKVEARTIRFTHRGPILTALQKTGGAAISMHWTGNEPSNEFRSLHLLRQARNWDDFKNAMKTFGAASQNTLYADTAGNIGLYCCASAPIRAPGDDGIAIMPGWTDAHDWQGMVPFEDLPHAYNPPDGRLCSANNRTASDDYPHYIGTWYSPDYRFRRIREMLDGKDRLSVEDFRRMQADWKSAMVADMRPDITASLERAQDLSALEKRCSQILAAWDGVMTPDSAAAAVFEVFCVNLLPNLLADELGDDLFQDFLDQKQVVDLAVQRLWRDKASAWYDNVATADRREGFDDVVRKSFADAVAWLQKKLGDDPAAWHWGDIHQLTLNHPLGSVKVLDRVFSLNRGPYPAGGAKHTVSPYQYKYTDPYKVYHGASHRHIYTPEDWDASLTVIPTGTCGVPASPHYCDQTALYLENRYHPDHFSKDKVTQNAKYQMTLVPAGS
ncbi:MAG: penicillin acylase family protein [Desulfobacterales bacterium]